MASISSWPDLPLDLLCLIVARLPYPADRARSRAVCRSWHSAVRHHGHQLSSSPGLSAQTARSALLSPTASPIACLPSPTGRRVASSDGWLIPAFLHLSEFETEYYIDSYLLHNEFSNTSIPLPELELILRGHQRIRRFRVRSTADGLVIAALTTNENYPPIVIRPGKGVWSPEPQAQPYMATSTSLTLRSLEIQFTP
ncbi:hypothetical protein ACQ4PT_004887 [Festuca glaucescens]